MNSFLTPTLSSPRTLLPSIFRYNLLSLVNSLDDVVITEGRPYAFDEAFPILSITSYAYDYASVKNAPGPPRVEFIYPNLWPLATFFIDY